MHSRRLYKLAGASDYWSVISFVPTSNAEKKIELMVTSSQASRLGVILFNTAGILPDPNHPYKPTVSNSFTWVVALLYEIAILSITQKFQIQVFEPCGLEYTQLALDGVKIFILTLMLVSFLTAKVRTTFDAESGYCENDPLVSGQDVVAAGYGSLAGGYHVNSPPRPKDDEPDGWLGYFIGFRKMTPYLW